MSEVLAEESGRVIHISAGAAKRIAEIKHGEGNDALLLRIVVDGGGCSGFQYGFKLDHTVGEDDRVFERDGVRVVLDQVSLDLLAGSEIEFVEELGGSFFSMKNPNATAVCGCGNSFAI